MKKIILSLSLCLLTSITIFAQNIPQRGENLFTDFLNEKVRTPQYQDVILQLKEIRQQVTAGFLTKEEANLQAQKIFYGLDPIKSNPYHGPVVSETARGTGGAEPFIAVNDSNTSQMILSFMSSASSFDYPIYYSNDSGTTWTLSTFSPVAELATQFPGETIFGGGDPVLAFDNNGTVHMAWIYIHVNMGTFTAKAGMFYAYSTDGGVNFTVPTNGHVIYDGDVLSSDMLDREWLAVDNSGGLYDGNVYMSSVYFGGALGVMGEVVLVKPADSTAFDISAPTVAVPMGAGEATQFGNIKVDFQGNLHLVCMRFNQSTGAGNVVYSRSNDGGATWTPATVIAPATSMLPNGNGHMVHNRDNSATSLAVDSNDVYIAWTDQSGNNTLGYYAYSNDNGITWSAPIEYGSSAVPGSNYHLMPDITADNGEAAISWYVVDTNSLEGTFNILNLLNHGTTAGLQGVVGGGLIPFATAGTNDFFGDYNTAVRVGCNVFTLWSDNRSGAPVVYVAKVNACNITGVQENTPINGEINVSEIYPNPADNYAELNISLNKADQITIELYDAVGKYEGILVQKNLSEGTTPISLKLIDYPAGIYFVKIVKTNGIFATRTLIVKRK